ncbi:MAG: hypothetical protein R1F54_10830 [Candidatus Zeuxoniibacter abyssi]|nr:MAG: hypothetical protein R1F54_10830 [Candidatus Persebacteraceae bacterium AB1(2)]
MGPDRKILKKLVKKVKIFDIVMAIMTSGREILEEIGRKEALDRREEIGHRAGFKKCYA